MYIYLCSTIITVLYVNNLIIISYKFYVVKKIIYMFVEFYTLRTFDEVKIILEIKFTMNMY